MSEPSATTEKTQQTPAPAPEPAITSLFRSAIGPINTDYYLPVFTRFEKAGRASLSWNWAASVYTLNWLVFRNLWGMALPYLGLALVLPLMVLGLGRLVLQWSESVEWGMLLLGLAFVFIAPGVWGNALFYRACRQKMAAALSASATLAEACALLQQQASSRQKFIRILATNAALLCLVVPLSVLLMTRTPTPPSVAGKIPAPTSGTATVQGALTQASEPVSVIASSPTAVADKPLTMVSSAPATEAASAPAPAPVVSTPMVKPSAPTIPIRKQASSSGQAAHKAAPASLAAKPASLAAKPASLVAKPASHSSKSGPFYVNVGLFADTNNVEKALDKVKSANLVASSQPIQTPKGLLTRVRAGPFDSRAQAEEAAKTIKTLSLDAAVVQP